MVISFANSNPSFLITFIPYKRISWNTDFKSLQIQDPYKCLTCVNLQWISSYDLNHFLTDF